MEPKLNPFEDDELECYKLRTEKSDSKIETLPESAESKRIKKQH